MIIETKIISMTLFELFFSKTTAPQQVCFQGSFLLSLSSNCVKFSVILWALCFLSYKKYIDPFK